MTPKAALKLLKNRRTCRNMDCRNVCTKCELNWDADDVDPAEALAIEALEKQVLMKHRTALFGKDLKERRAVCPECGAELYRQRFYSIPDGQEQEVNYYCWNCGQAISWGETK